MQTTQIFIDTLFKASFAKTVANCTYECVQRTVIRKYLQFKMKI